MNPFSQKTFSDSLDLQFPLLSDFPSMAVIKEYGVTHTAGIMANGAMFLVDEGGTIRARCSLPSRCWRRRGPSPRPASDVSMTIDRSRA